jgi:penicillin amidase
MIMGRKKILMFILLIIPFMGACGKKVERLEWIEGDGSGYDVSAPVHIIRDQHGVPHIRASNERDLFYALGYAMSQDRFFYMDMIRRLAKGDMLELLGELPSYKNYDLTSIMRVLRALDYEGYAEKGVAEMAPADLEILTAFCDGINRYLEDAGHTIPAYHTLNVEPEEWKPADSLAASMLFGLAMAWSGWSYEHYYARLIRELGADRARLFLHDYPEDAPYAVEDYVPSTRSGDVLDRVFSMLGLLGSPGSNNWVVSGEKSSSGKPILCNDPHVPTVLVTWWYHVHLEGGRFNVMGLMYSGLPVFAAGTNGKISWGLTNARVDYMDMFRERINPENLDEYWCDEKWRPFEEVRGQMEVRGGKTISYEFRKTVHGPVIDESLTGFPVPGDDPHEVYALRMLDVKLDKFFKGYLEIAHAHDWESFTAALKDMSKGPVAWNHVYADVHGNIGYYLSGMVPIRKDNQGIIPRRGWEPEDEWQGYIRFEELPHILNPKKGFIATANNRNTPEGYPYYVSSGYDIPSRAIRITEVLESKDVFDVKDMKALQYDVQVVSARENVPYIINDLEGCRDKKIKRAVGELERWREQNYKADTDSIGTSIYKVFMPIFSRAIFQDDVGDKVMGKLSLTGMDKFAIPKIVGDPDSEWYDDVDTPERERRQDIIRMAMQETVAKLEKRAGKKPGSWKWGKLQFVYAYDILGFIPIIGRNHRIGKYPFGGTE